VSGSIPQYFQLLSLIIQHGTFRHSGESFNQTRQESLKELQEFIPSIDSHKLNRGTTNSIIAQAAFIKNSFQQKGGHLTAGQLSYIRIPKSASTSMSAALLEKIYPALNQHKPTEIQINFLTDVNLQVHVKDASKTHFTIVRNPFSRLVSVYHDFYENKDSHFIYRDYLFGILPQSLSFAEFVDRISCIPDRLKDQHLKPQHLFLEYYEKQNISVKTFKLEDPEKLNVFLKEHTLQLPYLHKSQVAYDYREYYSPSLLKKVSVLYQSDLEKFGYSLE
jgi:hypothetical protein